MIRPQLVTGDAFVREFGGPVSVAPAPEVSVAVEVWAHGERWLDAFLRMTEHLQRGVTVVILLSEECRWLTVYRDDTAPRQFEFDATVEVPDLLPGFSVPVASLFA